MAALTITPANVKAASGTNSIDKGSNAGEAITQGQVVYKDSTTNKWMKSANDTAPHAAASGIALNSASLDQPLAVLTGGNINPGATLTVGTIYVVGATAGAIAPLSDLAAGNFITTLGIATTASNLQVTINATGVQEPGA